MPQLPTKVGGSGVGQLRGSIGRRIAEGRGGDGREVVGAAEGSETVGGWNNRETEESRGMARRLAVGFEGSDLAKT